MADNIDRQQLREELSSMLGMEAGPQKPSKCSSSSTKKKRSKSKKVKDTANQPSETETSVESVCRAEPSSSTPSPCGKSSHLDQEPASAKKNIGKKEQKPPATPDLTNKTKTGGNGVRIPSGTKAPASKNQKSKVSLERGNAETETENNKTGLDGKDKQDKQEAKSAQHAAAKQLKTSEKILGSQRNNSETKSANKKSGKKPDHLGNDSSDYGKVQGRGNNTNNNKPRPSKPGEEELTEELMKSLSENKMHILKKPNQKFRNARYFCRLCDFHLDQIEDCVKHIKDNRHCRRKEIYEVDSVLRLIPSPTEPQLAALTSAVDDLWLKKAIDPANRLLRQEVVSHLESLLQQHIPDVLLYIYGSSLTGFGLKDADINVDLCSSDKDRKLTFLLKEVHSIMRDKKDCGFTNVRADFSAKVPVLLLTDEASGLVVTMAIHCYSAHCSSELLAIYSDMDFRVWKLVVAFRYWAHICGLDRQKDGFIPPQALNLMVIYFLQTLTPQVIPIINPPKVSGEDVGDFRQDQPSFIRMRTKAMKHAKDTANGMSVGELWLRLLRFYSIEFDTGGVVVSIKSSQAVPRNTKPWNCKKLAVEDPYMLKKNITRMVNNSRIYEYWQDSIRKAYYYFGLPRDSEGKSLISEEDLKAKSLVSEQPEKLSATKETNSSQKSSTNNTIDKMQTDKDISSKQEPELEACADSGAVCIAPNPLIASRSRPDPDDLGNTSSAVKCCSAANTESQEQQASGGHSELSQISQKLSSVDLSNISIVAGSASILLSTDTVDQSLSPTVSPSKNLRIADIDVASIQGEGTNAKEQFSKSLAEDIRTTAAVSSTVESDDEGIVRDKCPDSHNQSKSLCLGSDGPGSSIPDDAQSHSLTVDSDTDSSLIVKANLHSSTDQEAGDDHMNSALSYESCLYDFDKNYFTDGKGPTLVCTFCEKEGHLKNSCPEDELPEVLNLPEMTQHHLKVLSDTLNLVPNEVGLSENSIRERWEFLSHLQEFIQFQFNDAQLTLFGSTCNGFGFDKSDLDICMTFSRRNGKIDKVHVIETLARRLKNYGGLCNVQAISTAKVPIVKFTIREYQLEADISLYNTLAQQNTKLLHCYSLIDPRVRILGYAIKTFAKVCDIGDASRGSLSSYAYILMMLYYLQQVEPPVIPVLQELYKGPKKPEYMVEDCDAWFMEDLARLDDLWPEKGKNSMSVAELWLGFLRFYVEEFNYKEFVVSIRQRTLLTRFEKLWNGTCVAVEDPFDLSHNLGSGLTRKMNNFIFKTFINGRMLYGSPIDHNMDMFQSYQRPSDYFFDTELLSENRPPNVRGCRRCGKIGHLVRACPLNRKDKEEEEQKQRQQRQQQQQRQHHQQQQQEHHMINKSQGGPRQSQIFQGRPQDGSFTASRHNPGHQNYGERDRWYSNNVGGNSSYMNNRHHGGGPPSAGNINRNSSATSNHTNNSAGRSPLLIRPSLLPQQQHTLRSNHSSLIYRNSDHQQKQFQQQPHYKQQQFHGRHDHHHQQNLPYHQQQHHNQQNQPHPQQQQHQQNLPHPQQQQHQQNLPHPQQQQHQQNLPHPQQQQHHQQNLPHPQQQQHHQQNLPHPQQQQHYQQNQPHHQQQQHHQQNLQHPKQQQHHQQNLPHHQQEHHHQQNLPHPQQQQHHQQNLPHHQQQQHHQQNLPHHQQQQHHQQNLPHHQQEQQRHQQNLPHHQQQQHHQQNLPHHQQEQKQQSFMAPMSVNNWMKSSHKQPGFSPQPMLTSTPRPVIATPQQQQQQQQQLLQRPPPPPGFSMIPHNHLQNQQYEGHQHHHLQQSHLHMQSLTSPQSQPQYSGGNQQTWIPVVQSLFANANRHAMNMDSNHPPNKNH